MGKVLSDVKVERFQFQSGDRLLAKVNRILSKDEYKKLEKILRKWAGVEPEILIVQLPLMDVEVERAVQRETHGIQRCT